MTKSSGTASEIVWVFDPGKKTGVLCAYACPNEAEVVVLDEWDEQQVLTNLRNIEPLSTIVYENYSPFSQRGAHSYSLKLIGAITYEAANKGCTVVAQVPQNMTTFREVFRSSSEHKKDVLRHLGYYLLKTGRQNAALNMIGLAEDYIHPRGLKRLSQIIRGTTYE